MRTAALLLLVLGAPGCELFHGHRREVRLAQPLPESCVRTSLSEVPGVTVRSQGRSREGFWFLWRAENDAEGGVSVDAQDRGAILRLDTGSMNGCSPEGVARGLQVMDALYDRLRSNCSGLPERAFVKEKRVRECR